MPARISGSRTAEVRVSSSRDSADLYSSTSLPIVKTEALRVRAMSSVYPGTEERRSEKCKAGVRGWLQILSVKYIA